MAPQSNSCKNVSPRPNAILPSQQNASVNVVSTPSTDTFYLYRTMAIETLARNALNVRLLRALFEDNMQVIYTHQNSHYQYPMANIPQWKSQITYHSHQESDTISHVIFEYLEKF